MKSITAVATTSTAARDDALNAVGTGRIHAWVEGACSDFTYAPSAGVTPANPPGLIVSKTVGGSLFVVMAIYEE